MLGTLLFGSECDIMQFGATAQSRVCVCGVVLPGSQLLLEEVAAAPAKNPWHTYLVRQSQLFLDQETHVVSPMPWSVSNGLL